MSKDRLVDTIFLKVSGKLVNSDVAKVDAIDGIFIVLATKLALLDYVLGLKLFYYFLDWVLEEALKREDLLCDKPILLKVGIDNFPGVVLVDWVHVGPEW